jgi:hypothetical protein
MKDNKAHWYSLTYVLAFVIGVILFWAFGKDWLDLESVPIFLTGLRGIAVAVIYLAHGIFATIQIMRKNELWLKVQIPHCPNTKPPVAANSKIQRSILALYFAVNRSTFARVPVCASLSRILIRSWRVRLNIRYTMNNPSLSLCSILYNAKWSQQEQSELP